MKIIAMILVCVICMSLACVCAEEYDSLYTAFLDYYDREYGEENNYMRKSQESGLMKLLGKSDDIGAVIDGCDVWSYTMERLEEDDDIAAPYSAEDLLIHLASVGGDYGWYPNRVGLVDYRYGKSKVRLKNSNVIKTEERGTVDSPGWESVCALYEFEIITGDRVFDLVLTQAGEPWNYAFLMPGSAELEYGVGRTDNVIGRMDVKNCEEWVSLRSEPRTDAPRIMKVWLGHCVMAYSTNGEFTAVNFDGIDGWILSKYLVPWDNQEIFEYEEGYLMTHDWRG